MHWIADYARQIAGIAAGGDATEFSYRTAIDNMLQAAAAEFDLDAEVLQEPSRIKHSGAPDFRVSARGGGIIGYVECKTPGENLQKLTTSRQLKKYRALSGNILLTDSWRWLLLREGKTIADVTLTERPGKNARDKFTDLLRTFMEAEAEKIGDAGRLAEALARRCAMLRTGLETHAGDDPAQSRLHGLLEAFRTALDAELDFTRFADTFAQTLAYSLLLAKLKAPAGQTLDLYDLNRHIPANFAVIREITTFLQDLDDARYKGISWIVEDILATINSMDAQAVGESMSYRNGGKGFDDTDDPYIYFYENFLAAYDARLRERRGVYYTPPPVVKFIVRAVDNLLRSDFDLPGGLAATNDVTALDFAAGTGTFMLEMIRTVLAGTTPAPRHLLTHEHVLKNFYGFELLMAPYAIAHLKLSQFLADNDVPLEQDERINIFLTNTLENVSKQIRLPILPRLAEEANRAQTIKDSPVLVITGNPPYSVASQNKGEWIVGLINDYKYLDGEPLNEKKYVLTDDYVKFIRFAQWKMDQVERGIVAVITNHGFLDNPTFRGMRKSLLDSFDALYFLDLHGNTNKKETTPDGGKDENVFDIRQGVAISILIKNPLTKQKGVFRADFWGLRKEKYDACSGSAVNTIQWRKINPSNPFYLFVHRDEQEEKKYEKFVSLKEIFALSSVGIMTRKDSIAVRFDKSSIASTIHDFQTMEEHDLREKYDLLEDSVNWKVKNVQKDLRTHKGKIREILYRPFDFRHTYYTGKSSGFHSRPMFNTMRHILAGENLGLLTSRATKDDFSCFCTDLIATHKSAVSYDTTYLFPLYHYDNEMGTVIRRENLNPGFRDWIDNRYGQAHSPEAILGCIYAILHSPAYRQRYANFLRTDFPRIPFPNANDEFQRLAALGNELIAAHLLRANCTGDLARHEGKGTTHRVEKVRYDENTKRLYFNKDEWFAPIPSDIFNFQIDGYQPLDKYLKSRKGRTLTLAETETLTKAANAIAFTIETMAEIDQRV